MRRAANDVAGAAGRVECVQESGRIQGLTAVRPPGLLAPLRSEDRGKVLASVGPTVDRLYPQGAAKLSSRLDDVIDGRAGCAVVWRGEQVVGLAVDSPKGRLAKLSTLWVARSARRLGIGSALAAWTTRQWLLRGVDRGHLTARETVAPPLVALLVPYGFAVADLALHRYGDEQHELVVVWRQRP